MGEIVLHNCDNMELMKGKPDKFFDLALVDPEYGIGVNKMNMGSRKTIRPDSRTWDNSIPPPIYFQELMRVSKNQIIWGGNYFGLPASRCFIVWDKGESMYGRSFAECEQAWVSYDKSAKIYKINPNQLDRIHPTQKPVELYKRTLSDFAKPGDKILDTHLGSGSIAIACHDLGFDLTACEIDADYYEAAVKRYNTHKSQGQLFIPKPEDKTEQQKLFA
jgi:site-specific DNA-methyltransferase (adenine-specific)